MKKYPIHENLSTSFVNLDALVGYLRGLQFVGSIHVELSSYDAYITFTRSNKMLARDHDHIAGRISEGKHAFRRILIRAKEPCGRIHVYRARVDNANEFGEKIFVDESIASEARRMVSNRCDTPANYPRNDGRFGLPFGFTQIGSPDLPFTVRKKVVKKTAERKLSPEEWEVFLNLMEELLRTIDESLAKVQLPFSDVFQNACAFVAEEHSFFDPYAAKFVYKNGELTARQQVSPEIFASGMIQALRRILDRLQESPKFGKVFHLTMLRLRVLMQRRKPIYDHYSVTSRLLKIFETHHRD